MAEHSHVHNESHSHCGHSHCGRRYHHGGDNHNGALMQYKNELFTLSFMVLGMVLEYCGVFSSLAVSSGIDLRLIEAVYYVLTLVPVGMPILRAALKSWRHLDFFNEFTLMAIASVGAFFISEYPEGVAILLFYSFGEKLEDSASDKARKRISSLLDKMPGNVMVEDAFGNLADVSPENVAPGTVFRVKPGERVALDAVLCGDVPADFDSSAVTGESVPVSVASGQKVDSGFIPVDREVRLKSVARYEDSTMSRIMSMVEESSAKKSNAETLLRKITRWYTPAVMIAAVLLFTVPWVVGLISDRFDFEWYVWLKRSLVLLVCSCPCALVVSVPLSYFVALGNASRLGVLFKGSRYLDSLRRVTVLLLDKTGTLTTGKFHVVDVVAFDGISTDDVLRLAASLDMHSAHPLANAIVEMANARNLDVYEADDVTTVPHGLKGSVGGRGVLVGSRHLMEESGVAVPDSRSDSSEVLVAIDGAYYGSILLDDTVKAGVAGTLLSLRKSGVKRIEILSGDRDAAVAKVASKVGADSYMASLLPADKHRIVERIRSESEVVAFVGDGINDAPSLAMADVGIAIGTGGSDVAMESADAVIMGNDLRRLSDAFKLSGKIKRVVTENVSLAIGVKLLVMVLGAFGIASLWAAVFADTGITLLTVGWTIFCLRMKVEKNNFANFAA